MTKKSEGAGFSEEEKAAMKERAAELKAQKKGADGEAALLEKVAEMPAAERELANGLHEVMKDVAPQLVAKTWYGMPAYATPDAKGRKGKVVVFFQSATKMQTRYCTVGFNDPALLDDGTMWATAYAITAWNDANEKRLRELVARALG